MAATREELLKQSEISLILDTYDDVFSDFDPRPYHERALSDDFLVEAKRAAKDGGENIELRFMIPKALRKTSDEEMIKKRLHEHFRRHHHLLHKEKKQVLRQGFSFIISSIFLLLITTLLVLDYPENNFFRSFMIILMEPAGWFLIWEGADLVVFEAKKKKPELDFYEKMAKCEIVFSEY